MTIWLFIGVLCFIALLMLWVVKPNLGFDLGPLRKLLVVAGVIGIMIGGWYQTMFYAEPTHLYHVRTALGDEIAVTEIGWSPYIGGNITPWKKAMSVQSMGCNPGESVGRSSATMQPYPVRLLDRVDGKVCATVRFRLPLDKEKFLALVREYRTPENFIITALIPAWKKTVNATSSMMTAESYYSGGRNDFIYFFEDQMREGIYKVRIKETSIAVESGSRASSNASKGMNQAPGIQDDVKIVFDVVIQRHENGEIIRNKHRFFEFGVQVVDAIITDFVPNTKFVERMDKQQDASAKRALAKEQRQQEQEQRLLAIARGNREVAEANAAAQVKQAKLTTDAETTKQLAITAANQKLESAGIDADTAIINLGRDKTIAQSIEVLSDADKYKRKNAIEADNGLALKLETLRYIAKVQADAQKHRPVPHIVIYGGDSDAALGGSSDVTKILDTQLLKNLNNLDLNMTIRR